MKDGAVIIFLMFLMLGVLWLFNYADYADAAGNYSADLLWETNTYTPPWYSGKALPVLQAQVKVAAVPYSMTSGVAISPSKLVYDWFLNYKKNINASGPGKRFFVFKINDYDDQVVNLKVSNQSGEPLFEKTITLSADRIEPKILFYEENILEGPRCSSAMPNDFQMSGRDLVIRAEPFFFSKSNLEGLVYEWRMNGEQIEPEQFMNILSLRTGEESGRASISLGVSNPVNVLQFAQGALNIIFGQ